MKIVLLTGNNTAIGAVNETFPKGSIIITGKVRPADVRAYLHIADYGIVPGSDLPGKCYNLLYDTMISSKAEEFLAVGLPVLVNGRITALSKLVAENESGLVYNENDDTIDGLGTSFDHNRISCIFSSMFCASTVVDEYKNIYENI